MAELTRHDLDGHACPDLPHGVRVSRIAHRVAGEYRRLSLELLDSGEVRVARVPPIWDTVEEERIGLLIAHSAKHVRPCPVCHAHHAITRMRLRTGGADLLLSCVDISAPQPKRNGN